MASVIHQGFWFEICSFISVRLVTDLSCGYSHSRMKCTWKPGDDVQDLGFYYWYVIFCLPYHCFVFLHISHLSSLRPWIGCKLVCFRLPVNESIIKCIPDGTMKAGGCIIDNGNLNTVMEIYYLFNGTRNGVPVNNTFEGVNALHCGKHAPFHRIGYSIMAHYSWFSPDATLI